jgi:hypothetical protein
MTFVPNELTSANNLGGKAPRTSQRANAIVTPILLIMPEIQLADDYSTD